MVSFSPFLTFLSILPTLSFSLSLLIHWGDSTHFTFLSALQEVSYSNTSSPAVHNYPQGRIWMRLFSSSELGLDILLFNKWIYRLGVSCFLLFLHTIIRFLLILILTTFFSDFRYLDFCHAFQIRSRKFYENYSVVLPELGLSFLSFSCPSSSRFFVYIVDVDANVVVIWDSTMYHLKRTMWSSMYRICM